MRTGREWPGAVSVVVQLPYGVTKPAASSFKLLLDGKRELEYAYEASETKSFLESGKELAWLLCVDVSGSMTREKLRDIQEALLTFLGDRKALRIALLAFASGTDMRLTFHQGDDRAAVTRAVRGLKDAGGSKSQTLLYDALMDALDYYAQDYAGDLESGPRRKRILVISDGQNDGGVINTLQSVESRSLALEVPIDAIGYGKIDRGFRESLNKLAAKTGGRFVSVEPEVVSLEDALSRVYREVMETQTVVAYFTGLPQGGRADDRERRCGVGVDR